MKLFLIGSITALSLLVGFWWFYNGPGFSGRVASLKLDDGSEYIVTQSFNDIAEPYAVHFYERLPGKAWGWNYLDHQSSRWRNAALSYDAEKDAIKVTEDGKLKATLERNRRVFVLGTGTGTGVGSERLAPQAKISSTPGSPPAPPL